MQVHETAIFRTFEADATRSSAGLDGPEGYYENETRKDQHLHVRITLY